MQLRRTPRTSRGLAGRLQQLAEGAELGRGRVDDALVLRAQQVVERAEGRLAVSGGYTVAALAGATGSGKSSLFNALVGQQVATAGVRRPTTAEALAVTWGEDPPVDLLDWLDVRRRHSLPADPTRDHLVLLDLPDHDSTEVEHRIEAHRLVQLVDLMVWVVDPQKYADAVLHEELLAPMAEHRDVMLVVLNQVDRLTRSEADACQRDLERLLVRDGLAGVPVLSLSAVTGLGVPRLQKAVAQRVREKSAAAQRLTVDVVEVARELREACGPAGPDGDRGLREERPRLVEALSAASGVPEVVAAVQGSWGHRGSLATGWPALSWLGRFRPDPLRRLHLDRVPAAVGRARRAVVEPAPVDRSSLPVARGKTRAPVDTALRHLADDAATGTSRGWSDRIREATLRHRADLPDQLDRAVAGTDLEMGRHRWWWNAVRVVQWVLVAAVLAGLLWLGVDLGLAYLRLPPLPEVLWWRFPAPTWLAVGGVLAGLLLAGASRLAIGLSARRQGLRARRALRRAVAQVAEESVLGPVQDELTRRAEAVAALDRAGR